MYNLKGKLLGGGEGGAVPLPTPLKLTTGECHTKAVKLSMLAL